MVLATTAAGGGGAGDTTANISASSLSSSASSDSLACIFDQMPPECTLSFLRGEHRVIEEKGVRLMKIHDARSRLQICRANTQSCDLTESCPMPSVWSNVPSKPQRQSERNAVRFVQAEHIRCRCKFQRSAPVLTGCWRELMSGAAGAAVPTMGVVPAAPVLEGVAAEATAAGVVVVAGGVVPGAGVMSTAIRCGWGWGCGNT
jgi:hypothetical protein